MFKDSLSAYQSVAKLAKANYFSDLILKNHSTRKILFSVINSVVNPSANTVSDASDALCESFLRHFIDKISNLRTNISSPHTEPLFSLPHLVFWDVFEPISLQSLKNIIVNLKPSFCPYDIIHPKFLKLIVATVGPGLVFFLNKCLFTGSVPANLKVATVNPFLKKPSLDPSILNNFRPISVLPFISKVLEKIVFDQMQLFLNCNRISEIFQSGFKSAHSTETALLRVLNDILLATDSGDSVVLVLLDLSAAFDTVDHQILLSRLESVVVPVFFI